jgi:hypothetical protein
MRERRAEKKADKPDKGPPLWQRQLQKGSPRMSFVIGALLTLPGASYLASLTEIHKLNTSTTAEIGLVLLVNLIMLAPLEVPLICFAVAPDWTPGAIDRAKAWVGRHAHRFAIGLSAGVGLLLVIRGIIEFAAAS